MDIFEGTINGIDVIATPGQVVRSLAFVSRTPNDEIQVTTEIHQLQTALELASNKKTKAEVSFETSVEKVLTRVRILDR